MNIRAWVAAALVLGGVALSASPSPAVLKVREWRAGHERQILAELMQLVSLPNIASNQADILERRQPAVRYLQRYAGVADDWPGGGELR